MRKETKGVSIIIPAYNAGIFLLELVRSILVQPFHHDYEIIVVDDGSVDKDTLLVFEKLEVEANVRIIRFPENKGVQYARNAGLRTANFDFVLTLDADDLLNTDKEVLTNGTYADRAIGILDSSPDVAFVHCVTQMFGDYDGPTISAYPVTEELVSKKHHVSTWIVCRKQDALDAGLYDESITKWQDWSFAIGILNARYKSAKRNGVVFLDQPYYLYRIHKKTQRISARVVSELDMTHRTILRHPDLFKKYYPALSTEETAVAVLAQKPSKLVDLLYMASDNIVRARQVAIRRGFGLVASNEIENIP